MHAPTVWITNESIVGAVIDRPCYFIERSSDTWDGCSYRGSREVVEYSNDLLKQTKV